MSTMPAGSLYTSLAQQCPDVHEHVMRVVFTSNKTGHLYSAIGLDYAHEQMNAQVNCARLVYIDPAGIVDMFNSK